jgi:hypothetical protein
MCGKKPVRAAQNSPSRQSEPPMEKHRNILGYDGKRIGEYQNANDYQEDSGYYFKNPDHFFEPVE